MMRVSRSVLMGLLAALILSVGGGRWAPAARAHGKELTVRVRSLVPDPDRPLTRLYRASVAYAGDGEPVEGASVTLAARREEGGSPLGPVPLTELGQVPGLYVGEVTYPRFGRWRVEVGVSAALGQGEGEASFVDAVHPASTAADAGEAAEAEARRVYQLQLSFRFDWWPDGVSVALRIAHSLAGASYFLLSGALGFMAWFGRPSRRPELAGWLGRRFRPLALASLGILLASGLYAAAFDAPTAPPGLYDPAAVMRLPYGSAYLGLFLLKPLVFLALMAVSLRMDRSAREAWPREEGTDPDPGGAALVSLRRLSVVNAALGMLMVAIVAAMVYLHYISHLGIFLPGA